MAEKSTKIILEREYTIPLRRAWLKTPRYKRSNKAIKTIKKFISRHMKLYERDLNKIKIDRWLNEEVWFRGIKKPPAKIRIKAKKYEDRITVELSEIPKIIQYKIDWEKRQKDKAEKAKLKKEVEKKGTDKKPEKKEEKLEEKKVESKEEIKETEEKKESVAEAAAKKAEIVAKQQKHETTGPKVKSIHRKALKK